MPDPEAIASEPKPMSGVRVLEVAQFTFVPAAGAVLADWGAEVIKVEHAERGDAQRGLLRVTGQDQLTKGSSFVPVMEGPNRGKRSIGLALEKPEAMEVLRDLVRRSDVFLTNFLPDARAKLGIDVDDIRAVNPDIIYTLGSGFGHSGPEAGKGGYDSTAFWARGGNGHLATPPGSDVFSPMPTGAYGDNMGGMTIAGGIAAALFTRERTGHAPIVDVSLLSVGAWATSFAVNMALMAKGPLPKAPFPKYGAPSNPLTGAYRTADDRWLMFSALQPGRYWPEVCRALGRPELVDDPRFATTEALMDNAEDAGRILADILVARPLAEWLTALEGVEAQWSVVQDSWELANDVSLRANGQIAAVTDAEGVDRELVANPVQFDRKPHRLTRAPQFAEHTDEILRELGHTDEQLIDLKVKGAVT